MKIWCCGQVSSTGQEDNIEELCRTVFPYFDGIVWTVNYPLSSEIQTSYTEELIKETIRKHKLSGRVIRNTWINLHAPGMTAFLQSGDIKNGDWLLSIDAQEMIKDGWLKSMRRLVDDCERQNITAVFWGRPYFFKYNDQMMYVGNPHCWPTPLTPGQGISIVDESKVRYEENGCHFGDFFFNKKKFDDTMIKHAVRYLFCYNISNETSNQYSDRNLAAQAESERQKFRQAWQAERGETTMESLDRYLRDVNDTPPLHDWKFIDYMSSIRAFNNYFRLVILHHKRMDIMNDKSNWNIKDYLKNG